MSKVNSDGKGNNESDYKLGPYWREYLERMRAAGLGEIGEGVVREVCREVELRKRRARGWMRYFSDLSGG